MVSYGSRNVRKLPAQRRICTVKYNKTCLKRSLKKTKNWFSRRLSLTTGRKYCRMLRRVHSAIRSTCIKLPCVFKTFILSYFEWPLMTGFIVCAI